MKQRIRKIIKLLIINILPIWGGVYIKFVKSITNRVTFLTYINFCIKRDKRIYWPVHKNSEVTHPLNIFVGINSNAATRPGCYLQGNGGIYIGNYVHFASNIGIISANHNLYCQMEHDKRPVTIGDYSWIGMNVIILPGVTLGERTIVGAGAVVTKSFPEGYCVIAGNPAHIIKTLDREKFIPTRFQEEFYGYVPKEKFNLFARKHLKGHKYYNEIIQQTECAHA